MFFVWCVVVCRRLFFVSFYVWFVVSSVFFQLLFKGRYGGWFPGNARVVRYFGWCVLAKIVPRVVQASGVYTSLSYHFPSFGREEWSTAEPW